ncbi:hypothetical protein ACQYWQ_17700 [Streptomyces sp. P6-2-1]|uniref:hypothetical protein n=1 Tax=Streptomyces sp. P6-2-1 TaxID=3422591 RepID=UPI003D36FB29
MTLNSRARTLLAVAAAAVSLAGVSTLAFADGKDSPSVQAAAAEQPGYAVETFDYPGADRIAAEQGVTLRRGDGHIVLAECDDSSPMIKVWTRESAAGRFCFLSTSSTGFLTLEVPDVYAIETVQRAVHAELEAEGTSVEVDVRKDEFKGVGEGVGDAPTVLLELRVTG